MIIWFPNLHFLNLRLTQILNIVIKWFYRQVSRNKIDWLIVSPIFQPYNGDSRNKNISWCYIPTMCKKAELIRKWHLLFYMCILYIACTACTNEWLTKKKNPTTIHLQKPVGINLVCVLAILCSYGICTWYVFVQQSSILTLCTTFLWKKL